MNPRTAQFLQQAKTHLPGILLHFDLADFKRFNGHFGHSIGDQVIAKAEQGIVNLTKEHGIFVRSAGDEWLAIVAINSLAEVNRFLQEFHQEFELELGWTSEASKNGETAIAKETTAAIITRAMRCLYTRVFTLEYLERAIDLLTQENYGFIPKEAVSLESLVGKPRNTWCCVNTYPESKPYCPFCKEKSFEWEDGDGSIYGGDGKCKFCGANISIRGVEIVA